MFRQTIKRLRWMQALIAASLCLHFSGCGGGLSSGSDSQTATLRGRIARADNPSQGLANAVVNLSRPSRSDTTPLFTTRTDTEGVYAFHNIPPGEYVLEVEIPDGSYQPIEVPVRVDQEQVLDMNLTPSDTQIGRIEIILPPSDAPGNAYIVGSQYQFTARVYDKDGRELEGWQSNWQIIGGVGSINNQGLFYAASAGTGEVVAYLYSDGQRFEARESIRVVDPEQQEAPWLLVPHRLPSGWGLRAIDARTKQERRLYNLYLPSIKALSIDDASGVVYASSSRTIVRLHLESGGFTSFTVPSYDVQEIVALRDDRVLLYSRGHYSVYDGRSGNELVSWMPAESVQVTYMALGPDGHIYCTGTSRDDSHTVNVLVRYRMEGDMLLWDATLTSDARVRRGIAFAQNGDMVVCEDNTIQAYTTSGVRLGRGFILPQGIVPNTIHGGSGGSQANDEVFFVGTRTGIWRVRYNGDSFSLFPEDGSKPFLKVTTEFLVWNHPQATQ